MFEDEEIDAGLVRISELEAENAKLKEALRFYADEKNYKSSGDIPMREYLLICEDGGRHAREALK